MKFSCLKIDTIYLISILLFQRYVVKNTIVTSVWNLIILYFNVEFHDIHSIHDIYFHLSVVVIVYLTTRARNASKRMNHDICPNSYIRFSGILWWYDSCIFVLKDVKLSFHHVIQFLVTRISSCGFKRKYTHTRLSILSYLIWIFMGANKK